MLHLLQMYGQMDRQIDLWTDKKLDSKRKEINKLCIFNLLQMDRQIDRLMGGQIDRQIDNGQRNNKLIILHLVYIDGQIDL